MRIAIFSGMKTRETGYANGAERTGKMKTIVRGEYIEENETPEVALTYAKEWIGKFISTHMTPGVEYVMKMSVEVGVKSVQATLDFEEKRD